MSTPTPSAAGAADQPLDPVDYSQYLLHSPGEIRYILRALLGAGDRITIHFNEGRDFLLTSVLAVDEDSVVLDQGGDEGGNRRAQAARRLHCVTSHEKVRVQFVLENLTPCTFEKKPAFRAPLPEAVLRLQRREFYRLATPVAHPLICRIPLPGDKGGKLLEATVADISGGGLALIRVPAELELERGLQLPGCRVELPEVGVLTATLEVRGVFPVTLANGSQSRRVGCQFVKLPGSMLTLVERYIIKVERERKARESGMG